MGKPPDAERTTRRTGSPYTPRAPHTRTDRSTAMILVRRETNPDDLPGMIAAKGILTERGGKTSHAAVVARGMGKTCVSGAEQLEVDVRGKKVTTKDGTTISEGDVLSI